MSSALYLTRVVGLSATRIGLALTVGALLGMLAGVPVGHLADRYGAREVYLAMMLVGCLAMSVFLIVHHIGLLVVVATLQSVGSVGSQASRAPLVRGLSGGNLVWLRAYLRSTTNLGLAAGALAGSVALQYDTPTAYRMLILGNLLSYLVCVAIVFGIPRVAPLSTPKTRRAWGALRDRPYMVVTALNGVMWVHGVILTYALPLWIANHTTAPRWMVSTAVIVNTAMVVVLQVRASRGVNNAVAAGKAMRSAGVALFVGIALMGVSAGPSRGVAIALIIAGVVVYTVGEIWHSAASSELMYGMAPAALQGQYVGVYTLGQGVANAAAPAAAGLVCLGMGRPGWLLMGLCFMATGCFTPAVVSWAGRRLPDAADGRTLAAVLVGD